jgi:hypothetical protein
MKAKRLKPDTDNMCEESTSNGDMETFDVIIVGGMCYEVTW